MLLRGEIAENQIFNEIYYASVNHKTGVGKDDTRDECRMLFMKLPPDKRKRLFSVLGFSEATKWEEKSFEEKQERESELDALLERKPQYGHFFENNNVYAVGMREELILDNIKAPQFIGTFGMGPCIGVGIISRGGEKYGALA